MSIERDSSIRFHELGTLASVTRWISSHDEGIAEWLKNVRRAYQPDRANVPEKHRSAIVLFQDASEKTPARIGLLDAGGASFDDVTAWSTWQDPSASSRGSALQDEETQGGTKFHGLHHSRQMESEVHVQQDERQADHRERQRA